MASPISNDFFVSGALPFDAKLKFDTLAQFNAYPLALKWDGMPFSLPFVTAGADAGLWVWNGQTGLPQRVVAAVEVLSGRVITVSATNGTDARLGLNKYDLAKPFQTMVAAKNAAASGDTIRVLAGNYLVEETVSVNGVNWHFDNGAVVTFQAPVGVLAGAEVVMFDTGNYAVTGNGRILMIEQARANPYSLFLINIGASGRYYDLEAIEVQSTNAGVNTISVCNLSGMNYFRCGRITDSNPTSQTDLIIRPLGVRNFVSIDFTNIGQVVLRAGTATPVYRVETAAATTSILIDTQSGASRAYFYGVDIPNLTMRGSALNQFLYADVTRCGITLIGTGNFNAVGTELTGFSAGAVSDTSIVSLRFTNYNTLFTVTANATIVGTTLQTNLAGTVFDTGGSNSTLLVDIPNINAPNAQLYSGLGLGAQVIIATTRLRVANAGLYQCIRADIFAEFCEITGGGGGLNEIFGVFSNPSGNYFVDCRNVIFTGTVVNPLNFVVRQDAGRITLSGNWRFQNLANLPVRGYSGADITFQNFSSALPAGSTSGNGLVNRCVFATFNVPFFPNTVVTGTYIIGDTGFPNNRIQLIPAYTTQAGNTGGFVAILNEQLRAGTLFQSGQNCGVKITIPLSNVNKGAAERMEFQFRYGGALLVNLLIDTGGTFTNASGELVILLFGNGNANTQVVTMYIRLRDTSTAIATSPEYHNTIDAAGAIDSNLDRAMLVEYSGNGAGCNIRYGAITVERIV
jgi:hypothetical protein